MDGSSERELLSTETVAALLGFARQHVKRLADRAGIEPAQRLDRGGAGSAYLWTREQVDALALHRARRSGSRR